MLLYIKKISGDTTIIGFTNLIIEVHSSGKLLQSGTSLFEDHSEKDRRDCGNAIGTH